MADQSTHELPDTEPAADASGESQTGETAEFILEAAKLSDVGHTRDHQEDTADVVIPQEPLRTRKGCLFIVADGMGGYNAGEVASQMAVSEIESNYYGHADDDVTHSLIEALLAANQAVYQHAQDNAEQSGMGTTIAMAVIREDEVQVANVGDSRVYLVRDGEISQITEDHSWVADQVRAGVLTPEQARAHPQRNIITRALGKATRVAPDIFTGTLEHGDTLILCSDGLTGHVHDEEIEEIVSQYAPEEATQRLIDLANERGGADNISVIVVRAQQRTPAAADDGTTGE